MAGAAFREDELRQFRAAEELSSRLASNAESVLARNGWWVARDAATIAKTLGGDETAIRLTIARAKDKMLAGRLRRITPYIDTTMYVSWNAMFVSAYLQAARTLGHSIGDNCRDFA